jgi:serine/threonine protein kinase/Tol biopolymer transport system component
MTLSSGSRLGPYEVLSRLGAGGMGEVWRARDPRLQREVAIKVLPGEVASDPGRLRRLEMEARAASALNHPNIVTIYEIGSAGSVSYIAMELVDGKTLRELLVSGPLSIKRTLQVAAQLADGLARAHEAGIVHRDLKPENVMVSKDGRVKILDFGVAKLTHGRPESGGGKNIPTESGTDAALVLGTVGYMSPEQASGEPVDFRSDQFSFGSILYELLSGKRAFQRKTGAETLSAIIREDPEPIAAAGSEALAPLRWLLERCLAKNREDRYASTTDLARDLTTMQAHLPVAGVAGVDRRTRVGRRIQTVLTVSLALAAVVLGALLVLNGSKASSDAPSSLRFRQATFDEQAVMTARFTSDGETFVYTADRTGGLDLFMARVGSPASRPLAVTDAMICSISTDGEMAFVLGGGDFVPGTLAQSSLAGGAPRRLLENVWEADWSPDGKRLAVVHAVGGMDRVEFPVGKVLYETAKPAQTRSAIRGCRVSPTGDRIAFIDAGRLTFADEHGKIARWPQAGDCNFFDWSPNGDEIWYVKIEGGATELRGLTPGGRDRLLTALAGDFQLHDVSRTGRILLEKGTNVFKVFGRLRGEDAERNLAFLAGTQPVDLSPDGSRLLFNEIESYGTGSTIYLREQANPPVQIGRGYARSLSPDGKWVIASPSGEIASELLLLPTGPGATRKLPNGGLNTFGGANWLPDGKRIVFSANASGEKPRIYLQDVSGGAPRPITPQGVYLPNIGGNVVSPDGKLVVGIEEDRRASLYAIEGGEPQPVLGLQPARRPEFPVQWSEDGRRLFVRRPGFPGVFLLDPGTGERKQWMQFSPDPPFWFSSLVISRDGKSYVCEMGAYSSNLFVLDGVH